MLHENSAELGSTIVLDEFLTKAFSSDSLHVKLKSLGVDFDSWISPDRYVFSFACSPTQVPAILGLITENLKNFNSTKNFQSTSDTNNRANTLVQTSTYVTPSFRKSKTPA